MALVSSNLVLKSSYEQLDLFISENISSLSQEQRKSLGKILPQLASETNKLKRLKDKENIIDILVSSLSRLLEDKSDFLNTLCFNLQDTFNLISVSFIDYSTNSILDLLSYSQESNQEIKKRIFKHMLEVEKYGQYKIKEDDVYIYYFSIYLLDTKLATFYFEREIDLIPNDFELIEEICDIVGALYNQVQLYQKLENKKNYTHEILNSQDNFTLITDGKYLKDTNKSMLNFFGYKSLEIFHKDHDGISDFFIKEDGYLQKEQDGRTWLETILERPENEYKVKIKDLKNNEHIFQINTNGKKIVEEEEEEEEVYVITFTDITELESKSKYISSILEASDEIQIILDEDENIIDFSNEATIVFSKIRKNTSLGNFLEEEEEEEEIKSLRLFLEKNKNGQNISHISHLQNRYFKVVYKLLDRNSSMIIFYDVSELKQQQQTLTEQSRLAAMGEMIANISHQWKQPLSTLSYMIQLLQFSPITTKAKSDELVNKALPQINYLSSTIEDFRTFFMEEKEDSDFEIKEAIKSSLSIVGKTLENKQIDLIIDTNETFILNGKQNTFAQVIINILNNAKDALVSNHIENKTITIRYGKNDNTNYLSIEDNAGGIPNDVLPKIFEPYFTTKFKDQGTGIGLYMSKMIVENQMGGKIEVSNSTNGAIFKIEFKGQNNGNN